MKKILPVLVLAGLAVGCSESQSAQNARVRHAHLEVNTLLQQAALPYVPGSTVDISQSQWRQQQQDKALEVLQGILKDGSPAQQITTRRLIADLHDSAARQQLNAAISSWTDLSNESALLMSYLVVVDRADAQLRSFSTDETSLIASLRTQASEVQKQSDTFRKDLEQWQAKARDLSAKSEAARSQAQQFSTQASRLREQAFTQSGADRLASYEKATEAELKANKSSAEAQGLEVQLNIANSNIAILDRQVKLAAEAVADGQRYIKEASDEQASQATRRDKAQQDKQQAIDQLDAELSRLVTAHQQLMDAQFQPALAKIDQAIELLEAAVPLTNDNRLRREIQNDILARKVSKLHLLSLQTSAASDWAGKLQVIHQTASDAKRPGGALIPARITFYETTAGSARNLRDQLASQALTVANEASELASQIRSQGGEEDPLNAQAQALAELVTAYTRQVNAARS